MGLRKEEEQRWCTHKIQGETSSQRICPTPRIRLSRDSFPGCAARNHTSYTCASTHAEALYPSDGHKRSVPKWQAQGTRVHAPTGGLRRWHRTHLSIGEDAIRLEASRPGVE